MSLLLTKGADVEADSVHGTPLHRAACYGKPSIVKFLLENNAEPNSVSKYLRVSPLVNAISSKINTVECVELLLKANADPNKLSSGVSPLAHAIEARSNSCINSLLAAGADVNLVSSCCLRPIEHAASALNVVAIQILLQVRPNWSIVNSRNSLNYIEAKQRKEQYIRNLKQNGDDAFEKQDYSSAIASYTEVVYHNPRDEKVLANRILCWPRLGEAVFALQDAELCVKLRPYWAKAHLREAAAWHLLKRYRMSSNAFKRAFELSPENEVIER